jgi:uncharacterized protein YdhG (YjbR/CyaY superfamily)
MSPAKKAPKKGAKKAQVFSKDEREAMRAAVQEAKASKGRAAGEKAIRDALAKLPPQSRAMGERLHEVITRSAPDLVPRTWYGMPAYARGDKVVLFFRNAEKFKERYASLGFNPEANLDEGRMWPVAFAITGLTAAEEERIAALVKKAVS